MELSSVEAESLWESERIASETVGRLMELWGFKRNMGRVWTVLFMADHPLSAGQLRERLQLSTGAVSMTLTELSRWGVVHKVWVQGERRDFYAAEANVWKMISRVIRERERSEISHAIESFEDALAALGRYEDEDRPSRGRDPERARVQRERIGRLLELAKLGASMLDALVSNAHLDATWLARFRLGRSR
jgi:DNA-binding transcriptional regulator GbsR (MarR family)